MRGADVARFPFDPKRSKLRHSNCVDWTGTETFNQWHPVFKSPAELLLKSELKSLFDGSDPVALASLSARLRMNSEIAGALGPLHRINGHGDLILNGPPLFGRSKRASADEHLSVNKLQQYLHVQGENSCFVTMSITFSNTQMHRPSRAATKIDVASTP